MNRSGLVFMHKKALVETDRIGEGTRIWAFAHVMSDVTIGCNCNIGDHVFIESHATLGDNVTVKNGVSIWEHVHVADNVFVGPNVALTNDRFPRRSEIGYRAEETWIEEGVTIGANATILCGIRLGRRAFIGAGSVVTHDVAPHALVYGNPARQRGWVCFCGRSLKWNKGERLSCAMCGRRYDVTESGAREVV